MADASMGRVPDGPAGPLFGGQLNDGRLAQMLAYNRADWNRWTLAFEDLNRGIFADDNFVDLVVSTESLVTIPEPTTMLLFGVSLIGVAGAVRRRSRR